ncbi:immunoglobulin [Salmonella enterica subsp. enterica]|nr:immunoglobulin [Salmonella enterica]EBG5098429.1 immunoglobulin [Salmonella enterica subsp. enterica serovar India]EBG5206152.1 immunoglobulin [Salmonella enterica subsp. enterica serovar Geraldton]EBG5295166.1 immunoglobulin [Salmonella enterica subsp. enterica]EDN7239540.1 immunoglobulin [Salmonella enterica subsp. enterica serovar Thompson]EEF3252453.1 immunoglobulin [Salmonella enterica subsp. enterica serovar Abony]EEJ7234440.1 immunoglobulin [Salmonella enterica subsp. salamae]EGZ43
MVNNFILLLFNKNNTVYLHVITNTFSPKSLFTSQYSYKTFRILNPSGCLFKL